MTLRLIVRVDDAGMAAHVGGSVLTKHHTFDVDLPEVERLLTEGKYHYGQLVGCEVLLSRNEHND